MAKHDFTNLNWLELAWKRPYSLETVYEVLAHLATLYPRGSLVLEIRSQKGYVKHLIGVEEEYQHKICECLKAHGNIRFYPYPDHLRKPVTIARKLAVTKPHLALNTEVTESTIRAGLAALAAVREEEEAVVQIVLGQSIPPRSVPKNILDPHASWLQAIVGSVPQASPETRKSMKEKAEQYCYRTCIRLGATGDIPFARSKISSILSAFRTLESAGVRIYSDNERSSNLNIAKVPWSFSLTLSIKELASFVLLPAGEEEYPGTNGLHPKEADPPVWYREPTNRFNSRAFAKSHDPSRPLTLSVSPEDSLEHTLIIGPTGVGKSTVLENLALADIYARRSVLLIDPKGDLVTRLLERIPPSRANDVVVINPADPSPVGFNPLSLPGDPALKADAILAVLKEIFAENWGIRSQDVLSAALLTLADVPEATLLWLPPLLQNEDFRRQVIKNIKDKIALKPYWDAYEQMRDSERRQEIAPVLNKIRQFFYRPGLRSILGQSNPKFNLADLFYKRRIVLVPLNKGTVGAESAKLLGSLIVGLTWTLALSRANIAPEKRHVVSMYIDELQDYVALPTDLSDALAQARGLGVGITMAHQYRAQLSPELRAGVDANARNKIVFGLNANDAKEMAAMAPELIALDFMTLPRYQVYTNFMSQGKSTGWIRGVTLPPTTSLQTSAELRALSQTAYGRPVEEVEAEFLSLIAGTARPDEPVIPEVPIGRRKL